MELRPKHLRAIELLVGTDLRKQHVATVVGVAPRTIARWLKDAAFREELTRQRKLLPYRIDDLRMEAAHHALVDLIDRFQTGGEKPPVKEITQLLDRLVGDNFGRARLAAAEAPRLTRTEWGQAILRKYAARVRRRNAACQSARSAAGG